MKTVIRCSSCDKFEVRVEIDDEIVSQDRMEGIDRFAERIREYGCSVCYSFYGIQVVEE